MWNNIMAFLFVIFFSDMVIKISNFDNFDIQNLLRECFSILRLILLQKISILGSVDNAENVKRFFFFLDIQCFVTSVLNCIRTCYQSTVGQKNVVFGKFDLQWIFYSIKHYLWRGAGSKSIFSNISFAKAVSSQKKLLKPFISENDLVTSHCKMTHLLLPFWWPRFQRMTLLLLGFFQWELDLSLFILRTVTQF